MKNVFYFRLLSSLYISTFLIRASFGIMLATLPIYLNIKKYTGYSIVTSASPLLELCTVLFIGAAVDRYGRKVAMLSGLLVAAVFLVLLAQTKSLYAIFFINAFHGIAAGAILVASLALLTDYAPKDRRGREMGAFDAVNLLGWVAGYSIGLLFIEFLGASLWQAFIIAGGMAVFGFVYSYLNITEPKRDEFVSEKIRFGNIISVLKQRSILLLTLPWFIIFMIIGAAMTFLTVSTSRGDLQISPVLLSGIIFGAGIVLIATQIFYGRLSDKYGRIPIMAVGTAGFVGLMSVIGLGYLISPATHGEGLRSSIMQFWPLIGIFGFMALAFGPSALSSLADESEKNMRGVTMAVYSVVISAGMFVGIPAVAVISDRYGGQGVMVFMMSCAVAMLCFMVARYLDVKRKKIITTR